MSNDDVMMIENITEKARGYIDYHGMSADQALSAVVQFLESDELDGLARWRDTITRELTEYAEQD